MCSKPLADSCFGDTISLQHCTSRDLPSLLPQPPCPILLKSSPLQWDWIWLTSISPWDFWSTSFCLRAFIVHDQCGSRSKEMLYSLLMDCQSNVITLYIPSNQVTTIMNTALGHWSSAIPLHPNPPPPPLGARLIHMGNIDIPRYSLSKGGWKCNCFASHLSWCPSCQGVCHPKLTYFKGWREIGNNFAVAQTHWIEVVTKSSLQSNVHLHIQIKAFIWQVGTILSLHYIGYVCDLQESLLLAHQRSLLVQQRIL